MWVEYLLLFFIDCHSWGINVWEIWPSAEFLFTSDVMLAIIIKTETINSPHVKSEWKNFQQMTEF